MSFAEMMGYKQKLQIEDLDLNEWIKLGDIKCNNDKLGITYSCYKDIRKSPFGRIYIIATDSHIVKIGGSQDKGGIESTINAYLRGDIGQSESMRNYAICKYMKKMIASGSSVEIWFLPLPIVEVNVPKFDGTKTRKRVSVDFHAIEKAFVEDYYNYNNRYPLLNIQESRKTWKELGLSEGWSWKN